MAQAPGSLLAWPVDSSLSNDPGISLCPHHLWWALPCLLLSLNPWKTLKGPTPHPSLVPKGRGAGEVNTDKAEAEDWETHFSLVIAASGASLSMDMNQALATLALKIPETI